MSVQRQESRWTNLAEISVCHPAHHHYPDSTAAVQRIVQLVQAQKGKCRVAGAGKSPNTSTFTNDHLIHMERMQRILAIDATARTITCEAGALMEDVMKELDKAGLMVRCVPSYVQTSVGGCIATATHSSGLKCHCLSDYVRALTIVDGRGNVRKLTASADEAELRLVACHLGVMGVVTEVTLEVHPRIQWRLDSKPLSMQDATNAALVAQKVSSTEYYRWWWVPHTDGCYESYGSIESTADPSPQKEQPQQQQQHATPAARDDAQAVRGGVLSRIASCVLQYLATDWVRHQVVEGSLWAACLLPALQPYVNKAYRRLFFTAPQVQRGSALECFTFDCLFRQWANEWAIDAARAVEAFDRLREMIDRDGLLLHFPVEFRFTAPDASAMSPAVGRPTCWVGVVMYRPHGQEARDTRRCYDRFSRLMEEMGGRPHWAKYYDWGHREVAAGYGENWERFLALRHTMDPDNIFVNEWFSNLLSPDRRHSTEYTS
ncbi:L-galactonolactone oxidase [Novymonas esmeraldas]|uniref:L-gulonolactone oxidase n=1 Tax=Novymonas esmeraldas TaxID=1808958 RepID=A0AAW0ERU1_9TRYP